MIGEELLTVHHRYVSQSRTLIQEAKRRIGKARAQLDNTKHLIAQSQQFKKAFFEQRAHTAPLSRYVQ